MMVPIPWVIAWVGTCARLGEEARVVLPSALFQGDQAGAAVQR